MTEKQLSKHHSDFDELWAAVEAKDEYWEDLARLQFTSSIRAVLRKAELNQESLARALGWKPAQVSRALCGGQNLTLRSMVKICRALNLRLDVSAQPAEGAILGLDSSQALDALKLRSLPIQAEPLNFNLAEAEAVLAPWIARLQASARKRKVPQVAKRATFTVSGLFESQSSYWIARRGEQKLGDSDAKEYLPA